METRREILIAHRTYLSRRPTRFVRPKDHDFSQPLPFPRVTRARKMDARPLTGPPSTVRLRMGKEGHFLLFLGQCFGHVCRTPMGVTRIETRQRRKAAF